MAAGPLAGQRRIVVVHDDAFELVERKAGARGVLSDSSTCPSASSRSRNWSYGTSCTAILPSIAIAATVAADWPRIMNTGSMRIEPKAMCELETQTGTSRFWHWSAFGWIEPRAIWYGPFGADSDISFVLHVAFRRHIALDVVRVHAVRAHADRLGSGSAFQQFVLRHHVAADHASRFADVDLVRPVPVVDELVLGQSPLAISVRTSSGTLGSLARKYIRPCWYVHARE